MGFQNRFFARSVVGVLCGALASPSFATVDEFFKHYDAQDWAAAASVARAMGARGEAFGTCMLGALGLYNNIPRQDDVTLRKLMSTCPGVNSVGATQYAAEILMKGVGGPVDSPTAGRVLSEAVKFKTSGYANLEYALWLAQSWDKAPRPADSRERLKWHAEEAVSQGQKNVYYRLGVTYKHGSSLPGQGAAAALHRQEAVSWFRRAAAEHQYTQQRQATESVMEYLALSGIGDKLGRDHVEIIPKVGVRRGLELLAYENLRGTKIPKNLPEARYWAESGIKLDYGSSITSSYVLGMLTLEGSAGLAQDPQRAIELFTKAHELRSDYAAAALAGLYADGRYVRQDMPKARQWLQAGYENASDSFKPIYAENMRYLDNMQSQANAWARQQAQTRKMSSEDQFLLGLVAFGVAVASQIDWSRVGERRSSGGGGGSYSEPFDFDKHQKTVYCTSYGMTSSAAFQFGNC